jgi:hypothetical protein
MTHVTIYNDAGYPIADGLQSAKACDAALIAARNIAKSRGEPVYVEDRGTREAYTVTPDGEALEEVPSWFTPDWDQD